MRDTKRRRNEKREPLLRGGETGKGESEKDEMGAKGIELRDN
jgi:hypothetical protein